jgi:hypothetical protein
MSLSIQKRDVVVGAALLSLVVGLAAYSSSRGHEQPSRAQLGGDSPLPGASRVTLGSAREAWPMPILRPSIDLASDDQIRGVWIRPQDLSDDPEVYIRYASGISVSLRPDESGLSTEEFAEVQTRDGIPGRIVRVSGLPVFAVSQSEEGDLGSIRFLLEGEIVTVIGHGDFPDEVLESVARSIISGKG